MGTGLFGSVMSIIWTPSSDQLATRAYQRSDISTVVMPPGPASASKPRSPSKTLQMGAGQYGLVRSIIWTASSDQLATRAYQRPDISAVATPSAPSSASKPRSPSKTLETGSSLLVPPWMCITCTPSSSQLATTAYVESYGLTKAMS